MTTIKVIISDNGDYYPLDHNQQVIHKPFLSVGSLLTWVQSRSNFNKMVYHIILPDRTVEIKPAPVLRSKVKPVKSTPKKASKGKVVKNG